MPCNGQSDEVNKPKFFGALFLTWVMALVGGNLHIVKVEGGGFTSTTFYFKSCTGYAGRPESCFTGVSGAKAAVSVAFWCVYMAVSGFVILLNACRIRKRCTVWFSALATVPLLCAIILVKKYQEDISSAHAANYTNYDVKLGPSFAVLVVALALHCLAIVLIQKDAGNDGASAPPAAQTVTQRAGVKRVV